MLREELRAKAKATVSKQWHLYSADCASQMYLNWLELAFTLILDRWDDFVHFPSEKNGTWQYRQLVEEWCWPSLTGEDCHIPWQIGSDLVVSQELEEARKALLLGGRGLLSNYRSLTYFSQDVLVQTQNYEATWCISSLISQVEVQERVETLISPVLSAAAWHASACQIPFLQRQHLQNILDIRYPVSNIK